MHTLVAQLSFLKSLIRKDKGEVRMDQDTRADANCPIYTFKGTGTRCKIARHCEGWYHSRCNPIRNDECTACSLPKEDVSENTVHSLTTEEIAPWKTAQGQYIQARQSPQSAGEQFTVHGPNGPIEKNVGAHTIKTTHQQMQNQTQGVTYGRRHCKTRRRLTEYLKTFRPPRPPPGRQDKSTP